MANRHRRSLDGIPCARCRQLRDRIAELEDILGTSEHASQRYRLLGLPPVLRRMLGYLVSRNVASRDGLHAALHGDRPECDQPEIKVLDQQIWRLRQALKGHGIAIKTEWGVGYSMPPPDKARLEDLLARLSRRAIASFEKSHFSPNARTKAKP